MAIKIDDFGGTDWIDGGILFADDLIETIKQTSYVKANGVIVVDNTSYGNQFADISFASGELGVNDTITIEILPFLLASASSHVFVKPIINDITTPQDLGEMDITDAAAKVCSAVQIISSEVTSTQVVFYKYEILIDTAETNLTNKTANTGESDPLTTAFTLRIDTKKSVNTSTIKYRVIIQRGQN